MSKLIATVPRVAQVCLGQTAKRSINTTPRLFQERVDISKIKELQKHFQVEDGVPVYLKGGLLDRVLFGTTVVLCVVGLGYGSTIVYKLSVPPTN